MADLNAAVRAYARQHGLTVPAARQRLTAAALFLDTNPDRTDAAIVAAFLHGANAERERITEAIGGLPSALELAEIERQADAAIEAYRARTTHGPALRLVHSAR